jgi:hypothetical protein
MHTPPHIEDFRIALLRPVPSSLEMQLTKEAGEYGDGLHKIINTFKEMVQQAAEEINLDVRIDEFQLHDRVGGSGIVAKKRGKDLQNYHVLSAFDPRVRDCAFITNQVGHPLQRGIFVFTSKEVLEDMQRILSLAKSALVDSHIVKLQATALQRIFAIHIPLNDASSADMHRTNISHVQKALLYPYTKPVTSSTAQSTTLLSLDRESRENQPYFRNLFTGEDEQDN